MKKVVFVLGILGSAFVYAATVPPAAPLLDLCDNDTSLAAVIGHTTPPVTNRAVELSDDSYTTTQPIDQTEGPQRFSRLNDRFEPGVSSRKKHAKRAASAESVRHLYQLVNERFEKQGQLMDERFERQSMMMYKLMERLSDLHSEMEEFRTTERVGVGGLKRLNHTVEHRLDLQNLHMRMLMGAFNELSASMKHEIATLKERNEQLQQQVADLTKKLADSKPN